MIKKFSLIIYILCLIGLNSCNNKYLDDLFCETEYLSINESETVSRICFGSCANQNVDQPLLYTAANQNPDLFLFLGDNIYGDTKDMSLLAKAYSKLCAKPEFQQLQATCPILAVWDDHDYGADDSGKEYTKKEQSKDIFMKFWGEENNSNRLSHKGIYDSRILGTGDKTLQIILLDNRTFRSAITYQPNYNQNATMLGEKQWQWLEEQLLKPAKVRIIATSTQFGVEYNGFEAWANFPLEQERMYNLIASTNASGVFFVSGDIHYAELSKRNPANTYPLYDFTASGITENYPPVANQYRIGNPVEANHVGMIDINWNGDATQLNFSIIDVNGTPQFEKQILLNELQF